MNKNVHNYLADRDSAPQQNIENKNLITQIHGALASIKNGGLEQCKKIKNWIEEKGEQIKDALINDRSKSAQSALRLFMTLSVITAMALNTTACDINTINGGDQQGIQGGNVQNITPITTTRSPEEIEETGLTANDVLAAYDELASDVFAAIFKEPENSYYDGYSCSFVSISPMQMDFNNGDGSFSRQTIPYYHKEDKFRPMQFWFNNEGGSFYGLNNQQIDNVYLVSLNLQFIRGSEVIHRTNNNWLITEDVMANLMQAYDSDPFFVTQDTINASSQPESVFCFAPEDDMVYQPITIDRELIKNSNEEQLTALMNAIQSMYSLNFYGKLPEPNQNYNFEIQ